MLAYYTAQACDTCAHQPSDSVGLSSALRECIDFESKQAAKRCLSSCDVCPRACKVNRYDGEVGLCGASAKIRVGRAALHWWEEPCLVGDKGSGAVFFSHCSLGCVYCQNQDLVAGAGIDIDSVQLAEVLLRLQNEHHAANINLVTPSHYVPLIVPVLYELRGGCSTWSDQSGQGYGSADRYCGGSGLSNNKALFGLAECDECAFNQTSTVCKASDNPVSSTPLLHIPVVYNTSSFDSLESLQSLAGLIDIYLADFKYASSRMASRLSHATQYPEIALTALDEMVTQVSSWHEDEQGLLQQGVIVRHLVLPGQVDESLRVLELLHERYGNSIRLSIMNQYTPLRDDLAPYGLEGVVSQYDYERVLDYADALGIEDYFWQEGGAATESFIPVFDGTGVI